MSNAKFDRRQITAGLAAAMALPLAGGLTLAPTRARAQSTGALGQPRRTLAKKPRSSASPYRACRSPPRPAATPTPSSCPPSSISWTASRAPRRMRQASPRPRSTRCSSAPPTSCAPRAMPSASLAIFRNRARPAVTAPKLEAIADDYRKLFATCQIRDANRSDVQWYVSKITDPARRKSYEQVTEETCVPWYFVAIIHGMEGGFDIKAHLHNGDPLKAKTVQVPKGRPDPLEPAERLGLERRRRHALRQARREVRLGSRLHALPLGRPSTAGAAARSTTSTRRISGASPTTTPRASSSPTTCGTRTPSRSNAAPPSC